MELYHYTSTDTMQYILKNGDIFATNIRYMNDSEEYTNGLEELYRLAQNEEMVKEWLKDRGRKDVTLEDIRQTFTVEKLKRNRKIMEYYSISFCQKNDLLSQWAIYAKESGVSIKMNFKKESYRFETDSVDDKEAWWNLKPEKVCYFTYESMKDKKKEYKEQAFRILDKLYDQDTIDQIESKDEVWRYVSAFVKRYDFYQEAESRLVFQPKQTAHFPKVQYRQDNNVLKPYLDIKCKNGWPVWEIMVGPGFNQQVVYNSVGHFLDHVDVKAGILEIEDYLDRVEAYLHSYRKELKRYDGYKELQSHLKGKNKISNRSLKMEDARIILYEQMQKICKEVLEDEKCSPELKEYIEGHYFTKSGIVLSRSSIPYIY